MSTTIPEDQGGDPRGQTLDYEAALAKINAAHEAGFAPDPAGAGGEPAPIGTGQDSAPGTPDQPTQAAREASPAPTDPAPTPTPTDDEMRVSKKEWDQLQRQVGQYGQNLQQQRAEFDQRVQQAIAGQGPDIDRRIADAAREAKREAIRELIRDVPDPGLRQQQAAVYQGQWDQEDARLAGERRVAEAEQLRTQAGQQIQQARQAEHALNSQFIALAMPAIIEGYAPVLAAQVAARLGGEVAPADVTPYLLDPENIQLLQESTVLGQESMNLLQQALVRGATISLRQQRAARAEAAATNREARDNAGLGRGQGGGAGGTAPVDLDQYKSSKTQPGNYDAMLAALNDQHMQRVASRR